MRKLLFFFLFIPAIIIPQNKTKLSGTVLNQADNTPLHGCNIYIEETSSGTSTDIKGRFTLFVIPGEYTLKVSFVGFQSYSREVKLAEQPMDIEIKLIPEAILTKEVTVTGKKEESGTISQEIKPEDLTKMPTMFNDVMRAVQILPGVISINELSSGYNVRGGNFDDNLIYLNGFEIYRPFLLRQGVEENQTLINPDLTSEFKFYNGNFPASYGDKMSSALRVNYDVSDINNLSAIFRADILNAGLTLKGKTGDLRIAAAGRYSYPGLFMNELQTNGDYKPHFYDIQLAAEYPIDDKSKINAFLLYAVNKYDLTPSDWYGSFGGFRRFDIRGLQIYYDGQRTYTFNTGLIGLQYSRFLHDNLKIKISGDIYNTQEKEASDVSSVSYYLPDAGDSGYTEYIKSGREDVANDLKLLSFELLPQIEYTSGSHVFTAGINTKISRVNNAVKEIYSEEGDSVASDYPVNRIIAQDFSLNSYSAFLQDEFRISDNVIADAGLRYTYYGYNSESMFSPRVNVSWFLSPEHNFTFSWGYYYQPPYYAELRNKPDISAEKLKSQRAIHYSAGWEYTFKPKLKLNIEAYYKDMFNLIPYYIDREKTEYMNANSNKGFAYGFDVMVQGEIVEGMNSWVGYGYLNTQEKNTAADENYHRRLTDNNHSIQVFLQDRIKKHPNWQSHLRLLFNTGYVFNLHRIETDESTGRRYIKIYPDQVRDYPAMYFRVDMGLSAAFDVFNRKLVVIAEVLNLFNHRNFGSYRFVQVSKEINAPFAIPQVLSSRFFNLGVEIKI